jgi:hypothetical protein
LPVLVLGAGDGRGFGGFVSPAKLALADGLDPVGDGFELRIHGVGGSSPEQMLEQSDTVQVGGMPRASLYAAGVLEGRRSGGH